MKKDYDVKRNKFLKLEEDYIERKNKESLMGERPAFEYDPESKEEKQNLKLIGAKREAYSALEVAQDTTTRLDAQTETMKKSKGRLLNVNSDLDDSNSLIKSMQIKLRKDKV
mmetsp:Transcript_35522/g.32010  ORF Transcript_35522/g.32010 Transcript_35522/m.32010 type:complete len:112 (+) Transcript_35522:43-378(+)